MHIEIYEKPRCGACVEMRKAFDKWAADNTGIEFEVDEHQVEDHHDFLVNELDIRSAPVYIIHYDDGYERVVSGNQPDMLVDYLNDGQLSLWDPVDKQ